MNVCWYMCGFVQVYVGVSLYECVLVYVCWYVCKFGFV